MPDFDGIWIKDVILVVSGMFLGVIGTVIYMATHDE